MNCNIINKICNDCNNNKCISFFYRHKRYKDGYRNQCIDCHNKRFKNYYNEKYKQVMKDRLSTDLVYKIKQNYKSYLHIHLKLKGLMKSKRTNEYFGCDIKQIIVFLQFQFEKTMNWDNKTWEIDHVIPLSKFDILNTDEQILAFHWTNIQPLFEKDNLIKYNNFNPIEFINHIIITCRFIRKFNISNNVYDILKKRIKYVKETFLQHFQIAGKSSRLKY